MYFCFSLKYQRSYICSQNISLLFLPCSSFSLFRPYIFLKLKHTIKTKFTIWYIALNCKRNEKYLGKTAIRGWFRSLMAKVLYFLLLQIFPFRCWWWFKRFCAQILTLRDSDTGLQGERPKYILSDKMEQQNPRWIRKKRKNHFHKSYPIPPLFSIYIVQWSFSHVAFTRLCFVRKNHPRFNFETYCTSISMLFPTLAKISIKILEKFARSTNTKLTQKLFIDLPPLYL